MKKSFSLYMLNLCIIYKKIYFYLKLENCNKNFKIYIMRNSYGKVFNISKTQDIKRGGVFESKWDNFLYCN